MVIVSIESGCFIRIDANNNLPDVSLATIFRGVFPFLGALIVTVIILMIFPGIAIFLPSLMG
jgi:TRAP-type mannitol/chloroaromatic compound transport system permease large subunit